MFVGRQHELGLLDAAIGSGRAELIILYGRRHVGKSALLQQRVGRRSLYFEALQGVPQKQQLAHFLQQLAEQSNAPRNMARDWREAFEALTPFVAKGRRLVVFDEFPWMASGRSQLVSLVKYFWDNRWKKNTGLTLVLCGSVASFMLRHIVHSQALHNRKTLEIELESLAAAEAKAFFRGLRSDFEVAKFLMTFGGIPKYLEQLDPAQSLADNLDRLCFRKHGFFVNEFETLFKEQFKSTKSYAELVRALAERSGSKEDLARRTGIVSGGGLTGYLANLEQAGFIRRFSPVEVFGQRKKTQRIVLWDEWVRFFCTFMEPHLPVIRLNTKPGLFERLAGKAIDAYFGRAFERLCMKNLPRLFEALGIDLHQLRAFGPFFRQPKRGATGAGCFQIDVLLHRRGDVLTIVECKFSTRPIGRDVIDAVQRKVSLLAAPSRFTVERVLVCAGDVTAGLAKSGYFHHVVGLEALM